MRRRRTPRVRWQRPIGQGASVFIGRDPEIAKFRKAVGLDPADEDGGRASLVVLLGAAGTGKTALMYEFQRLCEVRRPARCGPVVDLRSLPDLEPMLESIADALVEDGDDPFRPFRDALRKASDQRAQRTGGLVTGTGIVEQAATKANELAPGLPTGAIRASAELASYAARALDRPLAPDAVAQKFIECLLELARRREDAPVVLHFAYVDRERSNDTVAWIRSRLLPAAVTAPITVVLSGETEADLADLERLGKSCVLPLDRFSAEDSFTFVERAIGIPRTSRLAEQLVADCDGFPERLERYRVYFRERDPGARKSEQIPDRAREWAGGGSTLGQLERFTTPAAQRLVVHAAALRWFNAPLLREVAVAAGLADDTDEAVAELLDASRRPPWIGQVGAGWGITVALRRRDFVDECRRFDPAAYREVHERALGYHRARLGAADDTNEADPPLERRDNPDEDASVAELLYHRIALEPARGLAQIADRVAELLVAGEYAEAARLADIGPELPLPRDHVLLLRELRDAAAAAAEGALSVAADVLERVPTMACVTDRLAAAVAFQSGVCAWQLGRSSSEVIVHHQRAEEVYAALPAEPGTTRMRVPNLLWLAFHTANVSDDGATRLLKRAAALASGLEDDGLLVDIDQIRAQLAKDADEALRYYDRALARLESTNAPKSPASLLSSRASFLRGRNRCDEARADYMRALELHRRLEDSEAEAWVAVELISLELLDGDADEAAAGWEDLAVQRWPKDAFLRSGVALAYHRHAMVRDDDPKLLEKAVAVYDDALALRGEAVIYANRGDAHARLARRRASDADGAAAEAERALALADLTEAHRLAPHDVRIAIDLARFQRDLGDDRGAAETASTAADELVRAIQAYTRGHGSARRVVPRELRALFDDVVDLPIRGGPVAFVGSCAAAFPRSAELARVLATALRDVFERTRMPDDAARALDAFADAARLFATAGATHREAECELNRAELFAAEKTWESAQTAADRVLELDPGNVVARELSERIHRLAQRDQWGGAEGDTLFDPPVRVLIAEDLLPVVDPDLSGDSTLFDEMLPAMRDAVLRRTGVLVPGVRVVADAELPPRSIQFELHNVVRWSVVLEGDRLAGAEADVCAAAGVSGARETRPWDGGAAVWVSAGDAELLQRAAHVPVWDVPGVIAGTLQMVLEHEVGSFVGVEQASWIADQNDWSVPDSQRLHLGAVVRRLVEAGVAPDVSADVIERLLACDPRELDGDVAALAASTTPPPPPDALAYRRGVAQSALDGELATVLVRVPAGSDALDLDADLAAVLGRLCAFQSLPLPAIVVTEDPGLGPTSFAVDVDGVTRYQGGAPTRIDWDRAHPAAGPDGRTGIFAAADWQVRTVVGRAVEQVLWDDPGLLLTPSAALALVAVVTGDGVPGATAEALACALREVAHRRVPLRHDTLPDVLRHVIDLGTASSDAAVERHDRSPDRTIPDGLPLGIRDAVQVALDQPLVSLRVRVHVRHAFPTDLRVRLEAPDGTSAVLADRAAAPGSELTLEATPITDPALGVFVGTVPAGQWSIHVADLAEGDGGTLTAWTLELFAAGDAESAVASDEDGAEQVRTHVTRVERLTRALRPFDVSVRLGGDLHDSVEAAPDPEAEPLPTPLDELLHTVALAPQRTVWKRAEELDPCGFEVVVNGLPRARGSIPHDQVFVPSADDAAIDPWTCASGAWSAAPAGLEDGGVRPREWLGAQLARTLYDEIAELCDLGWTERLLDLVAEWFPTLATTIRDRYGPEQTAYALGRLASQSYSIRNLRLWEMLLGPDAETQPACDFDAAAPAGLSVAQYPGALAEFIGHELRATRWRGPQFAAIELDDAVADAVEAAVATGPLPEPVYAYPAGPLLESLDRLVREGAPTVLVTRRNIRRHVRRMVRAQFPTVQVIAEENVDPASPVVVTHRLTLAAPDALLLSPRGSDEDGVTLTP